MPGCPRGPRCRGRLPYPAWQGAPSGQGRARALANSGAIIRQGPPPCRPIVHQHGHPVGARRLVMGGRVELADTAVKQRLAATAAAGVFRPASGQGTRLAWPQVAQVTFRASGIGHSSQNVVAGGRVRAGPLPRPSHQGPGPPVRPPDARPDAASRPDRPKSGCSPLTGRCPPLASKSSGSEGPATDPRDRGQFGFLVLVEGFHEIGKLRIRLRTGAVQKITCTLSKG